MMKITRSYPYCLRDTFFASKFLICHSYDRSLREGTLSYTPTQCACELLGEMNNCKAHYRLVHI